jgi:hypothetical protein
VYDTVEPDTVGVPSVAPVDELAAVSALSAAVTTDGTLALSVVSIADAVPIVTVPVGPVLTIVGHTRMPAAATVAVSLRLVGATMNVNVVDAAAPEYVAANEFEDTDAARALNVPVDDTSALAGVTGPNVTGTVTDEPETSVSPVAKAVRATVVASTAAGIAAVVRLVVCPTRKPEPMTRVCTCRSTPSAKRQCTRRCPSCRTPSMSPSRRTIVRKFPRCWSSLRRRR